MASRNPQQPNVVFILSDDQGAWALGCAGNAEIKTPNLDRLARRGIRFENFFCTSPVCSPARASLMTGDIPSQHGVHDWVRVGSVGENRIDYLAGQTLVTDVLAETAIDAAWSANGTSAQATSQRPNFVRWFAHQSGMGPYYGAPMIDEDHPVEVKEYLSDALADKAIDFGDRKRREPNRSGSTWRSPRRTIHGSTAHPRQFTDLYQDCPSIPVPKSRRIRGSRAASPPSSAGQSERRETLIGYFAAVTAMDAAIGRVLDELERSNLAESTLIVFMSDNGMNCGHHGIWGKGNGTRPQNMYDTSVKVPCIIAQPGRIPAGQVSHAMLSGYDVFPTLVDYLGVSHPPAATSPDRVSRRSRRKGRRRRARCRRVRRVRSGAHGAHPRNGSTCTDTPRAARALSPDRRSG